ncbi:MAG: hypothetical protein WC501_03155 [Candidatus Micrarchaeia archaeon]
MQNLREKFFSGNEKEILFDEPCSELGNLIMRTNELPDLFLKIQKTGDDRSFVIISALVLESVLDQFLEGYIPKYKKLLENEGNFVFSTKINLLKSLELIPTLILSCAETVRKTRNKFAHNLNFDSLEKLGKDANPLKTQYNQIYSRYGENASDKTMREIFNGVVSYSISGLIAYIPNIKALNTKIRSKRFREEINAENKINFEKQIDGLAKEKPAETVKTEGFLIKKYKNGIIIAEKI